MKKSFLMTMAVSALALYSCSSESTNADLFDNEVAVNFSVSTPKGFASRAFADGTTATKLSYAVFEGDSVTLKAAATRTSILGEDDAETFTAKTTDLTLNLAKGKTFTIVFWADAGGDAPYKFDPTTGVVTIDNTALVTNDETRDAFYKMVQISVNGSSTESVTLTRPFAQLNIGTSNTDYTAYMATLTGTPTLKTALQVKGSLYNGFDLFTGEVTGTATTYTITKDVLPTAETLTVNANGDDVNYNYLSMNYLPVGNDSELIDVTLTIFDDETELDSRSYTNIPVKRNYRTNIIGDLLCDATTFQIVINQEFSGNFTQVVSSAAELKEALAVKDADIVLINDITLNSNIVAKGETNIDLGGNTLTLDKTWATIDEDNTLNIRNGELLVTSTSSYCSAIDANSGSTVEMEGVKFKREDDTDTNIISMSQNSTVTLKDCIFDASPSYNTTTNASSATATTLPIVFTAENCTFNGSSPLLFNVPSNVTLTNCTINGLMHGLVMRGGTAVVTDCTINMDYSDDDAADMASYFDDKAWGQGNTLNLGGLIMGNKQNPTAYQYPTKVTLMNTSVNVVSHDDLFPAVFAWANDDPAFGVTFDYDDKCVFKTNVNYANDGKNIVVNGVDMAQQSAYL